MSSELRIKEHLTLGVLVRACDDKKAWSAAYKKAVKDARNKGIKWVAPMYRKSV